MLLQYSRYFTLQYYHKGRPSDVKEYRITILIQTILSLLIDLKKEKVDVRTEVKYTFALDLPYLLFDCVIFEDITTEDTSGNRMRYLNSPCRVSTR